MFTEMVTEKDLARDIDDDRQLHIEAAIMRIMKAKGQLTHVQLIQETIDQLKDCFLPQIPIINKSIETLIERHYIERDSQDTYLYIL
jgi:hypothetical protein